VPDSADTKNDSSTFGHRSSKLIVLFYWEDFLLAFCSALKARYNDGTIVE